MNRRPSVQWSTTPFFSILASIVAIVVSASPRSGSSASCTSATVDSPRAHSTRMMASCRSPRWYEASMTSLLPFDYRDSTTRVVVRQGGDTGGIPEGFSGGPGSFHDEDLELPLLAVDAHRHVPRVAPDLQVGRGAGDPDVPELDPFQAGRQLRVREADLPPRRIDFQAQAGLEEEEDRSRGPGLRRAGHRVAGRTFVRPAVEAAEQLGHPLQVHVQAGVEEPGQHPRRR